MPDIDEIDIKILKYLAHDSRMKLKELAKAIALSEPSVKSRIEKLKFQNVIRSFTIDIDYAKLGYVVSFYVKICELSISFKQFERIIAANTLILEIHPVTGVENYIMRGKAKSIQEVEELLATLMDYGRISTSIILKDDNEKKLIDFI